MTENHVWLYFSSRLFGTLAQQEQNIRKSRKGGIKVYLLPQCDQTIQQLFFQLITYKELVRVSLARPYFQLFGSLSSGRPKQICIRMGK